MPDRLSPEIDDILATHHALLRREIPRLSAAWKEIGASKALTEPWAQLLAVLLPHMDKEEVILFPMIRALDEGEAPLGCGVDAPIKQMDYEHDCINTLEGCLRNASVLAGPYEGALLAMLDDLAVHARRESDDLFPRASARARALLEGVADPVDDAPAAASRPDFQLPEGTRLVRDTRGRCNTCMADVPARVVRDDAEARLEKLCPDHGITTQLMSHAPDSWERLDRFYFAVNSEKYPQRDYIVRMTEKCNLDCPICLARANTHDTPDLGIDRLRDLLSERRGIKIDLMAAEPTLREDLEDWIRAVKARGGIAALHTNGLKLANRAYAEKLRAAGVDEVFLQFDGLDDNANRVLRGRPLNKARLAALQNLRELGIATSLIVVVAKGVNDKEVSRTLRFALEPRNDHVREVFFLGLRMLGSARHAANEGPGLAASMLMPDEIVDLLTDQEPSIRRDDIENFNKLYFAMLSTFRVKKCLYVQHYMMVRDGEGGGRPISDYLDLPALGLAADRYAEGFDSHPHFAKVRLLASLARHGANFKTLGMLGDLARLERLFQTGMNLGEVPGRFLILGFITACDPHNFDAQVAVNCGKGEMSADGGFVDSGAMANVLREARFEHAEVADREPGAV